MSASSCSDVIIREKKVLFLITEHQQHCEQKGFSRKEVGVYLVQYFNLMGKTTNTEILPVIQQMPKFLCTLCTNYSWVHTSNPSWWKSSSQSLGVHLILIYISSCPQVCCILIMKIHLILLSSVRENCVRPHNLRSCIFLTRQADIIF